MTWKISMARMEDEASILELIHQETLSSNVIPREKIDWENFVVCKIGDHIVGCVGYKIWDKILPEVISTIVVEEYRGKTKIGKALVEKVLKTLKRRGFRSAFCLTENVRFFSKFDFIVVDVGLFPAKIIADCAKCPKNYGSPHNPLCPDQAMYLKL